VRHASLRNLAIGILRARGHRDIATALRRNTRDASRRSWASPAQQPDTLHIAETPGRPRLRAAR
jgi:hypothetical protein